MDHIAGSLEEEKRKRLEDKLRRELGDRVVALLDDRTGVEDVLLNADGKVWVKRTGSEWCVMTSLNPALVKSAMGTIASMQGTEITHDRPILETELPIWGARFEGIVEPIVKSPVFAIRQRATRIFTLAEYESAGALTRKEDPRNRLRIQDDFVGVVQGLSHREVITEAIRRRKNIVTVGATGSGKSTFMNAVLHGIAELTPSDRVVVIEDVAELQVPCENHVCLLSTSSISMQDCLRATMRLRPTRIVVGEVRGAEALTMLKAWNTGHPGGVCSVHANDAHAALLRLEVMVAESGSEVPQHRLIAEAVDVVISIVLDPVDGVRKVKEVAVVLGFEDGRYKLAYV